MTEADGPNWTGVVADDGDPPRGTAPAHSIRIQGDNGEVLEFGHRPRAAQRHFRASSIQEVGYHAFELCPICLAPGPTSREHVPPESMGGGVKTLVCDPCNNRLGSYLESHLLDWRDEAIRYAGATSDAVQGRRSLPRVLIRWADDERFVLIPEKADPAIRDMLLSGGFDFHYDPPDPNLYKLGALKHAYLTACLSRCEIPDTPIARVIRGELLKARDAPSRHEVPAGEFANRLGLLRSYDVPRPGSLSLVVLESPEDVAGEVWISLAGSMLVPWPLPDWPPNVGKDLQMADT